MSTFAVFFGIYASLRVSLLFALGDTPYSWTFSSAGDYTVSDATKLEVQSNTARLSVQNYATDGSTAALYHFDESSGNASDSSANNNLGTVTSGSYSSGILNNALSFNGATSSLTAADSSSLSLTGNFTVEAWTKFGSTWNNTASRQRQGILDKGQYQMYYDNETGKVVFEMAPSSATQWTQVAGPDMLNNNGVSINTETNRSWDANSKNFVWRQVVVGSDIYVALGSATAGTTVTGDAEVWKCTSCATSPVWSKVGGDGLNSSWNDGAYEDAASIVSDGTNVYVGIGNSSGEAEVWRYNSSTWTQVGGDTLNSSWLIAAPGPYERVTSLAADGTTIYAGLGTTAGDAEVWKCSSCDSSPTWTKVGGDGSGSAGQSWATSTYEEVTAMTIVNSTTLAVALGTTGNDGELWTCATSSCTTTSGWTKRGGDASGSGGQSWTNTIEEVRSLTSSGTIIYVGTGVTAGEADVWRCDLGGTCTTTSGWTQVGGDTLNTSWASSTYERVWSLLADGTTVYAGLGDTAADAELWRCTSCDTSPSWAKLGGDGTGISGQSWGNATGASFLYASSLAKLGDHIFVGASSGAGTSGAEVWSCDVTGSCTATAGWTRIAGQYLNKSWGIFNLNSVESMTTIGGKLYAGTGYDTGAATANSNATVWEFDGTNWHMIGGQGINSSWTYGHPTLTTVTYRSITSMTGYNGTLIVGLGGGTNGDAEVWSWNGSTWTKIGGDGSGSAGQSWAAGTKRSVPSMTIIGSTLYAGLQGTAAGDGEMWTCDLASTCTTTAGWTFRGGDATGSAGQSWNNTTFEAVWSMAVRGTNLYIGLGTSANDAEVWTCDTGATCTQTAGWTKMGGDSLNSGWTTNYEEVTALTWYRGELYAGLGASTGDAELWKWNGSSWGSAAIAGDGLNGSWTDTLYERVKSLATYNGDLIVGLGDGTGEGEVWRYNTSTWSRIGGDGANSGWTNIVERISALAVYRGKLYAGTGLSVNSDATIWAYGGNTLLESTVTSQNTSWHHIAATYNGSSLKLYIDGVEDASVSTTATMSDSVHPLLLGAHAGSTTSGSAPASFAGMIDEVRISNTARTTFTTTPYTADAITVQPTAAQLTSQIKNWEEFIVSESANGGSITYRLSVDGGTIWKYWDSAQWTTSASTAQANTSTDINANISTLVAGSGGIVWQAILDGDGTQAVTLNSVQINATADITAPANPSSLTSLSELAGASITTDTWYSHTGPYFTWSGATDTGGSGVAGYYVYFGTDNTADPSTAGAFQASATYTASGLVSGSTYYLRIKSRDTAQNTNATTWAPFIYKLDSTSPTNPTLNPPSPAGYAADDNFTFSWVVGSDASSGISKYQYKTGADTGVYSSYQDLLSSATDVYLTDAAYTTGENIFYLRTVDNAGNVSAPVTKSYYFAGDGASAPQGLNVNPSTNTENSFAFSWTPPATYSASNVSELTYCYTVNTLPSANTCTYTSAGATSLSASAFATQSGLNTFYVSAKNPVSTGGAINYGSYASISFTANTSAPGIPLNIDVSDISVKSSSLWKLTISWSTPTDVGSGVANYKVYRSTDDVTYAQIATTTGTAFVDTDLTQVEYFYKVRACDNVANCGAYTEADSELPTGKFTTPPDLTSGPTVSGVTTKKATISWSTDRASDTKIQYGTSAGKYFPEEASNSLQVVSHELSLSNLSAGTTYYYKAKWTDEDGNTGASAEKSFKTDPAPSVKEVVLKKVGIDTATLSYTATGASKIKIYYGVSASFGNVITVSTSSSESTYITDIESLTDDTKYFYKINALDSDGVEYDGTTLTFTTLPRPKVAKVRIQQIAGTAQPTVLVSWDSNTPVSSVVTYFPSSNPSDAKDEVNVELLTGEHQMILRGLLPKTEYVLLVSGRDKAGNEARSERQTFTTSTDTRPPRITNLKVEGSITKVTGGQTATKLAQLVVSWTTDEPATSQVEFGEGTGSVYAQKTQEDAQLKVNHLVVISNLTPSKVYHLRALTKDTAGNVAESVDTVTITPKGIDDALELVMTNLFESFGFLRGIAP